MGEVKKWKTLESEYISKEPWLTIRKDKMELPNGRIIPSFYVLEYPAWVNVIAITKNKEFVFVEQYRHGLDIVEMEICAGTCEKTDSSPLEAAKRELMEETGYGRGKWKLYMELSANPTSTDNTTYCFLASGVEKIGEQHLDETEDLSVHLLKEEEVREILEHDRIKQALMAAPLWKYFAENTDLRTKG